MLYISRFILITFFLSIQAHSNEVNLDLKQESIIEFDDDIVEAIIEDDNIVSVKEHKDKDSLKIKGKKKGKTQLDIHLRDGSRLTYQVFVGVSHISLKSALAKIGRMNDIRIKESNGQYVLTGKVKKRSNGIILKKITNNHTKIIIDKTRKTYRNSSSTINIANDVLEKNGFGHYQLKKYGKLVYLEGSKSSNLDHSKALKIARLLVPRLKDGVKQAPGKAGPSVSIDVLVLSYSHEDSLDIGLLGTTDGKLGEYKITSAKSGNSSVDTYDWTLGPFSHVLKLVQTVSNTKVLANPRIVVRSGEEASFHSGKENYLKIDTPSATGQILSSYQNIPTGIQLKVLPIVDKLGQIDVSIEIEDSSFTGGNNPETSKSKSSTKVTVQNGYSILLSGFKRKTTDKTVNKIPLLGDIPILGEIFKNRKFNNIEKNVMVLMTVKLAQNPMEQSTLFSDVKDARLIPGEFTQLESTSTQGVEFSIWD